MKKIPDKWFILPIILLGIYFIIRLINQAQIMWIFPLDLTNDISSYMAMLHFLGQYGFHAQVPNWYNGLMISFDIYPPGWFFSVYPLYLLTKNVQITAYLSLIINLILGFGLFYLLGRILKLSLIKTIAFYLFYFASPMGIGDFIRQMRMPEMFGWILFISLFLLIIYFKDKPLNYKFLIFIPLYALLIITHHTETILFSIILAGIILTRKNLKEIFIIFISIISGLILASPWWIVFLKRAPLTPISEVASVYSLELSSFKVSLLTGITNIILPLVLFFIFYLYWKSKSYKLKELIFFSPILIISFLFLTHLYIYIPLLNKVSNDPFQQFFIFFILFFFFAIPNFIKFSRIKKLLLPGLILVSLIFIIVSLYHTPWFVKPGELGEEVKSLLPYVNETYIGIGPFPEDSSYWNALFCYGAIYYNLNTSSGWAFIHATKEHYENLKKLGTAYHKKDCESIIYYLKKLKTTEVIAYKEGCDLALNCGLYPKQIKRNFCLYSTQNEIL